MSDVLNNELFEAFASASEYVYIYVCDMKTDLSRWSLNSVDYFDLPGEYMENAGEIWCERIHPDDRNIYLDDIDSVFSGRRNNHCCQYRAKNRYGEYVWVECRGSAIKDENGNLSVFAGLMTRLDNQNRYDYLTSLPTIHEFYNYNFESEKGAALLLGLDDFRKVINQYGYNFGNQVLVEFSRKLNELCEEKHKKWHLYRFGGDEFLILAPSTGKLELKSLFRKIKKMSEKLGPIEDKMVSLSASAGAVAYKGADTNRETIINNLEHSLEHAKKKSRGSIVFFSREIAAIHERTQKLRSDLKYSIENNFSGFELYFQPWVLPENHRIIGCEALLRWKGKEIQDSYPGEFIRVLEEDNDIRYVGAWVMEQAMLQQKEWADEYGPLRMSFNVSYQQFMEESFTDQVIETAKKHNIDTSHIVVELTESCQVESPATLAAAFDRLRSEGFQVALDDFGTAYASLELLKNLPADYIKVEHSFVRELSESGHEIDFIIIENLLTLCGRLDCKSVVEGVENEKVDAIIRNMDATYLQGYFYSRPICKKDFEKMLKKQNKLSSD